MSIIRIRYRAARRCVREVIASLQGAWPERGATMHAENLPLILAELQHSIRELLRAEANVMDAIGNWEIARERREAQ